jgi:hypothetical protein
MSQSFYYLQNPTDVDQWGNKMPQTEKESKEKVITETQPPFSSLSLSERWFTPSSILTLIGSIFTISSYDLTLFSKCFSSFAHATCSLSVLLWYLALRGIYLALEAAFPNNPTLRMRNITNQDNQSWTGLSPSKAPYSNGLVLNPIDDSHSKDYNSEIYTISDSKPELFPLRSPLLRES